MFRMAQFKVLQGSSIRNRVGLVLLAGLVAVLVGACDFETPETEGQTVRSNWLEFTITDVSWGTLGEDADDDGVLDGWGVLWVDGVLYNHSEDSTSVELDFFLDTDREGVPYAQPLYIDPVFRSGSLAPGEELSGRVSFDVRPEDGPEWWLGVDLGWTVASVYLPFDSPVI